MYETRKVKRSRPRNPESTSRAKLEKNTHRRVSNWRFVLNVLQYQDYLNRIGFEKARLVLMGAHYHDKRARFDTVQSVGCHIASP